MSGLIDWAFARARTIYVLIALAVGGGIYAYTTIPREGTPNIDIPILYVSVPFPGVSVTDGENLVAKPLEDELSDLSGLKEMTTYVTEGHVGVLLEFDIDFDKDEAISEVRARLDDVRPELPEDIAEPKLNEQNLAEFPVISIALTGNVPERPLAEAAEDLARALLNLRRVQEVEVFGVREEVVEVLIDPLRLESYDVTIEQLLRAVSENNTLVQAGSVEQDRGSFSVKLDGTYSTVEEIYGTPFLTVNERTVTFRDIAEIRRNYVDRKNRARINGQPAIILQVVKALGENVFDTVEDVRRTMQEETARWPPELRAAAQAIPALDESIPAGRLITQLENSVATAVAVILILAVILLGLRPALLISTAIPCSFMMTFCLLSIFGLSLNNMVMFGLTLSVGMLIDGAIVIVEYADRRRADGAQGARAYRDAAKRMFWPITTSTATTLCAFLPMLLWPGIPGQFMRQLPITLIFVLCSALVVALIFLPVVGAVVQRGYSTDRRGQALQASGAALDRGPLASFAKFLVCRPFRPFVCLAVVLAVIVGIVVTYAGNNRGVEFFVDTEPERTVAYVRARGNLSFNETDRLVEEVERRMEGITGVQTRVATAGGRLSVGGPGQGGPRDAIGQIYIEFDEWGTRPPGNDIIDEITRRTANIPGIIVEVKTPEEGPRQGKPVVVEVRGQNWNQLLAETARIRAQFEITEGLTNIEDTRPLPGIEWNLVVDRGRANALGASIIEAGTLVRLLTSGVEIGTYRPDDTDDELEIQARFLKHYRTLDTLDQIRLRTPSGLVPLSSFIERQPAPAVGSVTRRHRERMIRIAADVDPAYNTTERILAMQAWLDTAEFPPKIDVSFHGELEEQQESQTFLLGAFALALCLMFALLLLQFNSFFSVFLILLSVILSVNGVLLGMLVMGQTFSVIMTGIGVVALAGIVVNNNIILLDTYHSLRRQMRELDAIAGAVARRTRPVLLTTVTTMAGLCPMMFAVTVDFLGREVYQGQPAAVWWVQLATAIVFGLGFSTALTLVVTPSMLAARYWIIRGFRHLLRSISARIHRQQEGVPAGRNPHEVWTAYNKSGAELLWKRG